MATGRNNVIAKQFHFRLQTVLDVRTEELERAQQAVAREETRRIEILERIAGLDQSVADTLDESRTALEAGEINLSRMQGTSDFIQALKRRKEKALKALAEQEQVLAKVRQALQEAMIRKKALDRLKEKEATRYRQALEKQEEAFLAEIALNRHYQASKA